jgi:phage terminase large subunit GpA-like protein
MHSLALSSSPSSSRTPMLDVPHEEFTADLPGVADARRILFDELARLAKPETELTVSEFADKFRVVSPESGSPFPGPWRTNRVPYLREPMDCLHPDHPSRRVTLKASAQTGKSEVGVNWFAYIVDRAPGPMLTVLPTGQEAIKYNRVKLQPTIDASPRIRHRVRPENSRDEAAPTTAFKRFGGGFNQITTASSSKGLQMVSIRWLVLDEISGFPRDVDGRGSPSSQARSRQKAFGDLAKELALSTPGMAGECEISDLYDASDRRRFYIPCSHCGDFGTLKYEAMLAPSPATSNRASFVCGGCGGVLEEAHKAPMVANGRWVPTWVPDDAEPVPAVIPAADIEAYAVPPCTGRVVGREPGYAIWSAYSPMESWTDIWQRGQDARADPAMLKVFKQQYLGEPYEPKNDTPDWEKLLGARKAWRRGVVPWPGAVLTGFIDVQGNRFEWGLWAWGEGFQGWLVDRGVIAHDYTEDAAWAAIDALTARRWPTAGGGEIDVISWGIDSGAFTQVLYDRVGRRHALLATKGDNRPSAAPLKKTRADLRSHSGRPIAGKRLNLGLIGNFDLKLSVYEGLRSLVAGPEPGGAWRPGTLHLPDWAGEDELRQLTAEVLIDPREYEAAAGAANKRRGALVKTGERREWRKKPHQPNEALDIVVGARALAWGEGAGHLTASDWREQAAKAHGALEQPTLFSAPLVDPETPAEMPWPATDVAVAPKLAWGAAVAKFKTERISG